MTKKQSIIVAVATALFVSAVAHAVDAPNVPLSFNGRHGPVSYFTGPVPTLSGCSSACTIQSYSNSSRGVVVCTDGPVTCTVTFTWPFAENPPACVLTTTATGGTRLTSATSTASFSFAATGVGAYYYHCDGMLERSDVGEYDDPDL